MNFWYNCQKGFSMIELPAYYLFGIVLTAFGAGVGLGYKVGNPTITQDTTQCEELATHPDNTHWKKSLPIGRTYRNGRCVNVSCPYYEANEHYCSLIEERCVFIDAKTPFLAQILHKSLYQKRQPT